MSSIINQRSRSRGASFADFVLVIAFVAILALVGSRFLGKTTSDTIHSAANCIGGETIGTGYVAACCGGETVGTCAPFNTLMLRCGELNEPERSECRQNAIRDYCCAQPERCSFSSPAVQQELCLGSFWYGGGPES